MKKWMIVVLIGLTIAGCKEDPAVLDPPQSKLEGINSNWQLVQVTQVDRVSIQQATLDVSTAFINGSAMEMNFNSSDFTYTVTANNSPNYFGDSGTWEFDDNTYPTLIAITPAGGQAIILPLVSTIRPLDPYLQFSFDRFCGSETEPYIGYQFKFTRIN